MSGRPNLILAIVVAVIFTMCSITFYLTYVFWDELIRNEPASAMIRNIILAVSGPIAIILALWRSVIANWQAAAAHKQVETALQQKEIAQESFLRDRFQRAAEMLGHNSVAARIGGVQALAELAAQNMDQYYVRVVNLLEAFAEYSTGYDDSTGVSGMNWNGDIQVARDAIDMLRKLRDKGVKRIEMDQMQDLLPDPSNMSE